MSMTFKQMKFFDELLGPFACLSLYWHNLFVGRFTRSAAFDTPKEVKNILVIKFFGMGSIILAGPMLRALRAKFPTAKIILLTFTANREICSRINLIDEVITIETRSIDLFLISLLRAISEVRKRKCEISLDLEFFAKSSTVVQYLCGSGIRVGYYLMHMGILIKMMWRGDLLTHNVYYNPHRHTSETFLALARTVGADTDNMNPAELSLTRDDFDSLENKLRSIGIRKIDNFLCMNINASQLCLERRWPMDNFARLLEKLQNGNIFIILTGEKSDTDYVARFVNTYQFNDRVKNLCGQLDIGTFLALLKTSKLLVTNDSGPLHIAVSLGIPTVSLFGPEIPERFGPRGVGHQVFYAHLYCSPCLNVFNQKTAPCNGDNKCMQRIRVDDVYQAVVRLLPKRLL